MTLKEFFSVANELGFFPDVTIEKPVRHSSYTRGKIVEVNIRGVGVKFKDLDYTKWFAWKKENDNRSTYAEQLKLVTDKTLYGDKETDDKDINTTT